MKWHSPPVVSASCALLQYSRSSASPPVTSFPRWLPLGAEMASRQPNDRGQNGPPYEGSPPFKRHRLPSPSSSVRVQPAYQNGPDQGRFVLGTSQYATPVYAVHGQRTHHGQELPTVSEYRALPQARPQDYTPHYALQQGQPPGQMRRRPSLLSEFQGHPASGDRLPESRHMYERGHASYHLGHHAQSELSEAPQHKRPRLAPQEGHEGPIARGAAHALSSGAEIGYSSDHRRGSALVPKLEAVSPSRQPSCVEEGGGKDSPSKLSKEELLQSMDRVDREIAKVEQQISKLQKKQGELEEKAAKPDEPEEVDALPEPKEPRHQSIVQIIYAENRKKAEAAHKILEGLGPKIDLPLYNQPSDTQVYHDNIKTHQAMKKKLLLYFKRRHHMRKLRERYLCQRYDQLFEAWEKRLERIENGYKRKAKDAKVREFYEKMFPEIRKQREQQERFSRTGARGSGFAATVARSDAEMAEIMDSLSEQEMRQLAVVPPMMFDEDQRRIKFINKNGLIKDPMKEYKERQLINTWTEEEKQIFKENQFISTWTEEEKQIFKEKATEESSKRDRGGSRRRSSGREREEGGTSPGGSAHHVRENDRHDSRQKSSSPAMPVLSADGSQQEGDGEQKQPPTVQQDGNLPSDGDISSGGGDGSKKTHDSEAEFSPTNVRISALEQSFASMSQRLEAFQELTLAQFEQSSPRKRRSARPETAVPEKRRKEDSASARSGKQRSPSHDGAEGESVSGDSGEHPAAAVPEKRRKEDSASARSGKQRSPSHDGAEGESVGGDSGASDSVWKPFDPTNKDTMHSWVADDVVFSEVEKYFKHDQQRRGTDLEAWQQKFSMPDNAPSTMVAPSFNDNIARAVVDNDKKQGEQIISHDKALKNIHSNLVHIGTPLMNLWQMIQRCNSENFEELQLEMSDCAGSALVLLGSLHSQLAFTRRTFIAESSQKKFRDLFKAASEDPKFLFPPDMGSKAKDLSSETKVLVGMLSQDDQGKSSVQRRGARRGGGRATGGGFSYSYRNSRYMPRANYGQYSYRGSQTRQFYNRNQSFQSKSGDGKQKQSK
ncbi:nuclear receptor co-repressor 1 [Branchiostoma belcheri]|nr:nuclear receptor co-repressor 1 [Branchiostoma belcheri]